MIALIIHIVFWGAFFHVIRSSKARGCNMMVVGAVNYLLASLVCFGISMVEGNLSLSRVTLLWGCAQGVAYVTVYYLIHTSVELSGISIISAILRLSVVIPVLASIFWWGEIPGVYQVVGIFTCLCCLPLIGTRARNIGEGRPVGRREILIVGLLFAVMGFTGVASKAFVEINVTDSLTTFLGVLYAMAGLVSLGGFLSPSDRKQWRGAWDGIKLGIVNVMTNVALLMALEQISGVVAFPVQAVGCLMFNTLFAAVVWGERFHKRTLIGIGLAAFGLVLVNLR